VAMRCRRAVGPLARALAAGLLVGWLAGCGGGAGDSGSDASARTAVEHDALPGTGRPLVKIGDKNFTEQFVLGELYAEALKAQGYSVVLNRDIGPTEVVMQALGSGRLSIYPEYVSTWNTAVAHDRRSFRSAQGAIAAARDYAGAHGFTLLDPTPFSDTGAIAVRRAFAEDQQLRTIGDLRKVAQSLALGAPPQFQQSPGGLLRVEQSYGFVPAAVKALPIGLQYQALDQDTIQAAYVSTTDGALRGGPYRLLKDPRKAFGWGQAMPVVPTKVLAAEGPAFARTINRVSALLDLGTIRRLNAAVDIHNQDPATVAARFLRAHGLIPAQPSS